MLPAGRLDAELLRIQLQIQPSAPEDGRNYHPKHVELIGISNKPLLLHLVGVRPVYRTGVSLLSRERFLYI